MDLRTIVDRTRGTDVLLLVGVLVMGLGIMPLVNGLYGYYVTVPAIEESGDAVKDAAAELGIGDIPALSADGPALLFATMILTGICMVVGGAALLSVAVLRRRRCVEKRP